MSLSSWLLASGLATIILTAVSAGSQVLGLTRMSFPLMLGTIVTPNRGRALAIGSGMHLLIGLALGAVYVAYFHWLGRATWWLGTVGGALHAAMVLLVLMPLLPGIHPRMATESFGPDPTTGLEPPGPLGRNYGYATPVFLTIAHLLYGAVLGSLYPVG